VILRISDAPVRVVDGPICKGACYSFIFLFFFSSLSRKRNHIVFKPLDED
ncbi:hypothetical protein M433DRAFT_160350, partial [Acidomyces richmondensis BFW]